VGEAYVFGGRGVNENVCSGGHVHVTISIPSMRAHDSQSAVQRSSLTKAYESPTHPRSWMGSP